MLTTANVDLTAHGCNEHAKYNVDIKLILFEICLLQKATRSLG